MALLKLGMIATEAKGKLGGHSLQMQRGRCVALSSKKPSRHFNVNVPAQQWKRTRTFFWWRTLTQAQKKLWNDFAKSPEARSCYPGSKSWSGFNWYVSCNCQDWISFIVNYSVPPTVFPPRAHILTGTVTWHTAGPCVVITTSENFTGYSLLFSCCAPCSRGKKMVVKDFKYCQQTTMNTSPQTYNFTGFATVFGFIPQTGATVYIRLQPFHSATGIRSVPFYLKATVIP